MRKAAICGVLCGLAATAAIGKDVAPRRPIVVRPAPVPARFEMRVQESPRFKKQDRPTASKPATVDGLQVTVQPEKKTFAGNGPVAFEVTLKNVSEKPVVLRRATFLGGSPKLVVSNQKTAAQWTVTGIGKQATLPSKSATLQPGKSVKYTLVVESQFVGIPLPRPVPFPRRLPAVPKGILQKDAKGRVAVPPAVGPKNGKPGIIIGAPIRRRPFVPPVVWNPSLPCGQGSCRGRVFLEFAAGDAAKTADPVWTGKIASNTFDFEVSKPAPVWTPGQPLKKEQAIRLAHPVAERALTAAYTPVAGLRPAKVGPWIESPEKTAAAKQGKAGNWTVSWTSFPRTGHSYNVTVTVSRFGGASVKEIFTGYSKAP